MFSPADKHQNPTAPNKSTLSSRYADRVAAGNGGFEILKLLCWMMYYLLGGRDYLLDRSPPLTDGISSRPAATLLGLDRTGGKTI